MCDQNTDHGRVVRVATARATVVNTVYLDGSVANASGTVAKAGQGGGGVWGPGGVSVDPVGGYVCAATGNLVNALDESLFCGHHILTMTPSLAALGAAAAWPHGLRPRLRLDAGAVHRTPGAPQLAALDRNHTVFIRRLAPFTTKAPQARRRLGRPAWAGGVAAGHRQRVAHHGDGSGALLAALGVTTGATLPQRALAGSSFARPTAVNGAVFVVTWTAG